jgi:hypothetical protein
MSEKFQITMTGRLRGNALRTRTDPFEAITDLVDSAERDLSRQDRRGSLPVRIFVDTSYYVARIMPKDRWHQASIRAVKPGMVVFTSSPIVNETSSLLQSEAWDLLADGEALERTPSIASASR